MDQQDFYENQLRMARENQKNSPKEKAKEQLKKEVKKQVLFWFCTTILPWIALIGGIAFIIGLLSFMACDNSTGGMEGWIIAKILRAKGLCPF